MGPRTVISTTSPAPVASELPMRAMAPFPPGRRPPMTPEPTTMVSSRARPDRLGGEPMGDTEGQKWRLQAGVARRDRVSHDLTGPA